MDRPFPWEIVALAAGVTALIVAIRYPGSRRWIAALVVLAAFGFAAFTVLMIGLLSTMDVGGGLPPAAAIGSLTLALVGLVLAGLIAFARRSPRQS